MPEQQPRPCHSCKGDAGRTETHTGENGALIRVWVPCGPCSGTGIAR